MKKLNKILLLLVVFTITSSFSPKAVSSIGLKVVVIDAGHGGKDPGCHGKSNNEKDVALSIALKLGKYISEKIPGVKVVYTRKTDVFIELQKRAEIANEAKADLFISIHCNAACYRDKKTRKDVCKEKVTGTETYVMAIKNESGNQNLAVNRENAAIEYEEDYEKVYKGFNADSDESNIIRAILTSNNLTQSIKFATMIQNQYGKKVGRVDRGVKRASLWVLWRTAMPSVLTEIGYLTNPSEERFLASTTGQDYIASALFRAFREYKDDFEGSTKMYDEAPFIAEEVKKTKKVETSSNNKTAVNIDKTILKKVFKVQLMSSINEIPLTDNIFKGVLEPGSYIDNGIYKYTAGLYSTLNEANKLKNVLREKGFVDAFVIAMKGDERIPLR